MPEHGELRDPHRRCLCDDCRRGKRERDREYQRRRYREDPAWRARHMAETSRRIQQRRDTGWTPRRGYAVSYASAHAVLGRDLGSCVDCGVEARHWALDHSTPVEFLAAQVGGGDDGMVFSHVPWGHYLPKCAACNHADGYPSLSPLRDQLYRLGHTSTALKAGAYSVEGGWNHEFAGRL